MSMLCCEMKVSHARSVHWLYDCPSQTRKEDIMGIDISHIHTVEVGYDEFCGALAARDLQPLWKIAKQLMPEVPLPATQAWLWRWDDVLPLARRAGELITLERGGDRRVLALANPGLRGLPFTSTTLWGALQYLGPHEPDGAGRVPVSGCRFVRPQVLERTPERRAGKRKTSQPRIGERQHAPVAAPFERDQFARTPGQRQDIIPLPEPGLGSRKRNFRHELLCYLPERLQIARRKRTTKLVVPNLHCVNVADVNSHNVLLPGLRRAVVEPVYAPGMGDFHLTA